MAEPNGTPRDNVSRRLFQEGGEEVAWHVFQNATNEMLDRNREEAKARWNFDFKNEVPLDGDWVWEKMEDTHRNHTEIVEASKENKNPNT